MAKTKRTFYKIRKQEGENCFLVSKFSKDLDVLASYGIYPDFSGLLICNCPSHKRPCKHIAMLQLFHDRNEVGGFRFFDPDLDKFLPIEELG